MELTLRFNLAGDRFSVVAQYGERTARGAFVPPLGQEKLTHLARGLENLPGWSVWGETESALAEVGTKLFEALFSRNGAVESMYRSLKPGDRVALEFAEDAALLLALPWEYLTEPRQPGPVALQWPLVRRLGPAQPLPPRGEGLVRALMVVAEPLGGPRFDARQTARELEAAVRPLVAAGRMSVDFLPLPATAEALARALSQQRYDLVQLVGPGGFGLWTLEGPQGQPQAIDAARLNALFQNRGIRLVLLTACLSDRGGEEAPSESPVELNSVALALAQAGVSAVVAWPFPTPGALWVAAATRFLEGFYVALGGTPPGSLEEAIGTARSAWPSGLGEEKVSPWRAPTIYLQTDTSVLFADVREAPGEATLIPLPPPTPCSGGPLNRPGPPPLSTPTAATTINHQPSTINHQPSTFVGRGEELLTLNRWLARNGAVVLTGESGIGKTALAREAAAWQVSRSRFPGGVLWVDGLAEINLESFRAAVEQLLGTGLKTGFPPGQEGEAPTEPPAQPEGSAGASPSHSTEPPAQPEGSAGASPSHSTEPPASRPTIHHQPSTINHQRSLDLKQYLQVQPTLIVLDLGAGELEEAELRDFLTAVGAPSSVLILSRSRVEPLPTLTLEEMEAAEAEELFVRLARAAGWDGKEEGATVGEICYRLDYRPGTIETFAPQAARLPLGTLAEQIDTQLKASLEAASAALSPAARDLFLRLSVFPDGAEGEAIAAVGQIPDWPAAAAELVENSLLRLQDRRYTMRPPVRDYAREQLAAQEMLETYERRAAEYGLAWAQEQQALLSGEQAGAALAAFRREETNLLAFLDWYEARSELDQAVAYAEALFPYLHRQGRWDEMAERAERLAAACADRLSRGAPREARPRWQQAEGRMRFFLGVMRQNQGQWDEAEASFQRSLRLCKQANFQSGVADNLHQLGLLAFARGDPGRAQTHFLESLSLRKKLDDRPGLAASALQLGVLAQAREDYDDARDCYRRSLAVSEQIHDRAGLAEAVFRLGSVAQAEKQYDFARECYRRSLALRQELGDRLGQASSLFQLGRLAELEGQPDRALEIYRQAIEEFGQLNAPEPLATAAFACGHLLAQQDQAAEGLLFLMLAAALWESLKLKSKSRSVLQYIEKLQKGE